MADHSETDSAHVALKPGLRWPPGGWPLFWLLSLPISAIMLTRVAGSDLAEPETVSELIQFSVRWGVPFIYLVVAASALPVLFPGDASRWLLRNRRYIGLVFAVTMAWQGLFIFLMSTVHKDWYYDEVYFLRDELEGSSGYLLLSALVLTSFTAGRRQLTPRLWKILHRTGVFFLWAYPFSVYWWNLSYYGSTALLDYLFYSVGFLAMAVRILAWGKRRQPRADKPAVWARLAGFGLAIGSMVLMLTGARWQQPVTDWLLAPEWSSALLLWLPYWPFEPFLPLLALWLGIALLTPIPVAPRTSPATASATSMR